MKSRFSGLPVLLLLLLLAAAIAGAAGKMMSVQVRKGDVRATPHFLGKIVSTLSYGDRVEVVESRAGWIRVAPAGKGAAGWMHTSALSDKRIVLKAGGRDADVTASGGELALAGKGFNADVEAEFKAKNRNLDFSSIDRMQSADVPPEKVAAFLREGGLVSAEGGAR